MTIIAIAAACLFVFVFALGESPQLWNIHRGARAVRAKDIKHNNRHGPTIYQFQSSSSSSFGIFSGVGGTARAATDTTSGSCALPRVVLPAPSSSSINDGVGGADAGASAEKIDCDTSESSTEARFWPFENLDNKRKHKKKEQRERQL
jgi:hypothetical protein